MSIAAKNSRKEHERYIKALTNPETIEEWAIALQNPDSPIYKLMMAVLSEQALIKGRIEILFERWVNQTLRQNNLERAQILIDRRAAYELRQKKTMEAALLNPAPKPEPSLIFDIAELRNKMEKLTEEMLVVALNKKKLQNSLVELNNEIKTIDVRWRDRQEKEASKFIDSIASIPVIIDENGERKTKQLSPEKLQRIKEQYVVPSVANLLRVNPAVQQQITDEVPEPIEREKLKKAVKKVMVMRDFLREFQVLTERVIEDAEKALDMNVLPSRLKLNKIAVPTHNEVDVDDACEIYGNCRKEAAVNEELKKLDVEAKEADRKLQTFADQLAAAMRPKPRALKNPKDHQ